MTPGQMMDKFEELCEISDKLEILNNINWFDMSVGFFLACDASISLAYTLALKARDEHQYWI